MDRPIVGFHQDEELDWVAELCCGHHQHVRHDPPFTVREWASSEAGRAARVGTPMDCSPCDRSEMPPDYAAYQRTKVFTEETVPAGLLAHHATKRGVWGLIHVSSGSLQYSVDPPLEAEHRLTPGVLGVVVPEVRHSVKPIGAVSFFVEFWRRPS